MISRLRDLFRSLDDQEVEGSASIQSTKLFSCLHFSVLVGKNFLRNRCPIRASALAYTTLLALVPVLAMVVSISTIFLKKDGEKPINDLIEHIITTVAPQLSLMQSGDAETAAISRQTAVRQIMGFIENVQSGTIGVTAGLALIFVGISLLSTIEATFNDIWGVSQGRTWANRIVQYWFAITLGPIFLIGALVLTTGTQFEAIRQFIEQAPLIGGFIFKLMPIAVLTIALTLFYKLMPHASVPWPAALTGGLVGGCVLQLNNVLSVLYMSRVVTYSKIYGSLGVVPIFLVGLYFSWMILLFGAQVAYVFQNRQAYLQEKQAESVNQRGREFIALRMMALISQRFEVGLKPLSRVDMSVALGIPSRLAAQILVMLVSSRLLIEITGEQTGYVPARPIEKISVEDVLQALRSGHGKEMSTKDEPARSMLKEEYERVLTAEMQIASAVSMQTLVSRLQTLPPSSGMPVVKV